MSAPDHDDDDHDDDASASPPSKPISSVVLPLSHTPPRSRPPSYGSLTHHRRQRQRHYQQHYPPSPPRVAAASLPPSMEATESSVEVVVSSAPPSFDDIDRTSTLQSPTSAANDRDTIGETTAVEEEEEEEEEEGEEQEGEEGTTDDDEEHHRTAIMSNTILSTLGTTASILLTPLSPLARRFLRRPVLADKLPTYSPLLHALSTNGRYAFPAFFALYLLSLLLLWMPLYLLSLIITEFGTYTLLLISAAFGGRCLLRLLAFPGTNVRVYGEVESEYARYGRRMLEGGCGSMEAFGRSLLCARGVRRVSNEKEEDANGRQRRKKFGVDNDDDDCGWDVSDIPATYRRSKLYERRVLGVYREVLHCLLEEGGRGGGGGGVGVPDATAAGSRNGFFYGLGTGDDLKSSAVKCKEACKRNLCCNGGTGVSNAGVEGDMVAADLRPSRGPGGVVSDGASDGTRPHRTTTTRYGNNPLVGDVGDMSNLTAQARIDGRELLTLLASTLECYSELESSATNVLRGALNGRGGRKKRAANNGDVGQVLLSPEGADLANELLRRVGTLREFVATRIAADSDDEEGDTGTSSSSAAANHADDDDSSAGAEAVRRRLEERGGTRSGASSVGATARSALRAIGSMIDPPPHGSILGLDAARGTFLARYAGARQFWVARGEGGGGGGRLDVVHVPSSTTTTTATATGSLLLPLSPRRGRSAGAEDGFRDDPGGGGGARAVLYCNPNAGLMEVATGMGLTGGNVGEDDNDGDDEKEPTCWTEYYIEHGYDVYLFNYAGYGRSFGGSSRWNQKPSEFSHGFLGALKRVLFSTFLAFKPSSESLKSDAAAVARHLVEVVGVDELIIHGESIGGMAAAGAARALTASSASSSSSSSKPSTLLICDRTFCNLEAVAQRLVGRWTGNAIRLLTPTWSTDVARDFLAARCPKIVANDCADEIIHDYSSLKTGLAFAGELTRGQTNGAGWMVSAPLEYRMADLDDVGVLNSRMTGGGGGGGSCRVKRPPTWPADKHVSWSEAYHFAACVKRIGKLATAAKKRLRAKSILNVEGAEEGVEVAYLSSEESSGSSLADTARSDSMQKELSAKTLIKSWNSLACCDGLCGHPLGHAAKEGFDCTVAWLCCTVVFGSHVLLEKAEKRWDKHHPQRSATLDAPIAGFDNGGSLDTFLPEDFDLRPEGYQWDEDEITRHPLPIPLVLSSLKETVVEEVEAELNYIVGMLEYIVSRLSSKETSALSLKRRSGQDYDEEGVISTGLFQNIHCGHNNQFSLEERQKLMSLIRRLCATNPV